MKKTLLSLVMLLGVAGFANAETVTLSADDATDVVGTPGTGNNEGQTLELQSLKIGDFSFSFTPGTTSTNSNMPKYWSTKNGMQIRVFGSAANTMTITSPENTVMTEIKINLNAKVGCEWSVSAGELESVVFEGKVVSWTSAEGENEVTFTCANNGNNTGNPQITSFEVTYTEGGGGSGQVILTDVCSISPQNSAEARYIWSQRGFVSVDFSFDGNQIVNKACQESITMTLDGEPFGQAMSAGEADIDGWGEVSFVPGGTICNGEFVLDVPEGFFLSDGDPIPAYTATYLIEGVSEDELVALESVLERLMPADDQEAKEMWTEGNVDVEMEINGEMQVTYLLDDEGVDGAVTLYRDDERIGYFYDYNTGDHLTIAGNEVKFHFAGIELADGVYTLNIPEGFFSISNEKMAAYSKSWTIASEEVKFVFYPEDGEEVVEELEDVLVDVMGASSIAFADGRNTITLSNGSESVSLVGVIAGLEIDYMVLSPLDNGEWTASIPANSLIIDGAPYAEDITWKFTLNVQEEEAIMPEISPAAGDVKSSQLAAITLTFPEGSEVVPAEEDNYMVMISPAKPASGFSMGYVIDYEATHDNVLVLKYTGNIEEMATDTWTLTIYPRTYTVNGLANSQIDVVYNVTKDSSAVEALFGDAEVINAYNVNGTSVIANGKAADLKALPAGVYVINGVKVMIRK